MDKADRILPVLDQAAENRAIEVDHAVHIGHK